MVVGWQILNGGFLEFQTVQENKSLIEDSPNTLNLKAHHINVDIYGSKKI